MFLFGQHNGERQTDQLFVLDYKAHAHSNKQTERERLAVGEREGSTNVPMQTV